MKTKILICLLMLTAFLAAPAFNQIAAAQNSLVGFVKTPPQNGFGCYFVLPADINKAAAERRYLFLGEGGGGLMNIGGSDLKLTNEKSYSLKSLNGKKRFVWVYAGGGAKVTFNLTQTKTTNDGENVHFDAIIKAVQNSQIQTIKAKGFCGG